MEFDSVQSSAKIMFLFSKIIFIVSLSLYTITGTFACLGRKRPGA
uniref:Glycerol-3-phosphate dehydrogenase SDP6-like isoform X1 n=1 Tax=Rhizophora mucronata TaxID=61149 RepID=A0A2P2K501_RHIMU